MFISIVYVIVRVVHRFVLCVVFLDPCTISHACTYIELSSDVTARFPEVFSPFIFLIDFS